MFNKVFFTRILTSAMFAVFIINVIFLFWYVFIGYENYFHSDSAAKVLLAREIYDNGSFFPPDWNYVNGDLFVVFGHIFIVPLLSILPAGFTVHAISGIIFSGLIIYGIWLVSSLGNLPLWHRVAILAIFVSGFSGVMIENLYGQVSYGVAVFFCCYILYFSIRYLLCKSRKNLRWGILLLLMFILAYWANPKRAFVTYNLPLFASLFWLAITTEQQNSRKYIKLFIISSLGAALGSILHLVTLSEVNNVVGAANARWLSFESILNNIPLLFKGLYGLLGGLTLADYGLFSLLGLYTAIRFIVATLIISYIPFLIIKKSNSKKINIKFIAIFSGFSLLLTMFFQVTTTIPDMSDPIQSARYLVPGLLLCILLFFMQDISLNCIKLYELSVIAIGFVFILSGFPNYRLSGLNSEVVFMQPGQINKNRNELLAFFDENNLKYGYATYWNAGSLSVLSNERTKVRQISLHNGVPMPMRHLSSNNWYETSAWKGSTFLLLTDNEINNIDWNKMELLDLIPFKTIKHNNFTTFIFKNNIAENISGWDRSYKKSVTFLPSKSSLSQTGRFVSKGKESALVAEVGESGALHYGPYIDIEKGNYRVTFNVVAGRHDSGSIRLDVAASPDQKIYGEKILNFSDTEQIIDFSLDTTRTIEFRVWALGNSKVELRSIKLENISKPLNKELIYE